MHKILQIIALLIAITARAAVPTAPTEPPVFDTTFQGVSLAVDVVGTYPTTYQWYRGTATDPKKVKIPAPQGIQRDLVLGGQWGIPYVAGLYVCEATNAAGSSTSKPFKVSTTKTISAPDLAITVKTP